LTFKNLSLIISSRGECGIWEEVMFKKEYKNRKTRPYKVHLIKKSINFLTNIMLYPQFSFIMKKSDGRFET